MKRILYSFVFLTIAIKSFAQMQIGEWQAHLSYNNIIQTAPAGELVYGLSDGALFSYNKKDQSVQLYDKINALSDNSISYIKYSKTHNTLIIVYKNSNIDLLTNGKVYNIPDFMNKIMNDDKSLNSININGDYAYFSTNFGVLILDLKRKEITNTYFLKKKVFSTIIKEDDTKTQIIYAATDKGVYSGSTQKNLLDINNWQYITSDYYSSLHYFDGKIFANSSKGISILEGKSISPQLILPGSYMYIDSYDGKLIAGNSNYISIINNLKDIIGISLDDKFNHISYSSDDKMYWGSNGIYGLNGYTFTDKTLIKKISSISPNSPKRNLPYYMTFSNNRLLICGGGMTYDRLNNPGTIMMMENGNWSSFQEQGIKNITREEYKDITSIIEDPKDPTHHFASSGGEGIYEFNELKFTKLHNIDNSTLQTILPNAPFKYSYIRTNGLQYDTHHNLWMVNSNVNTIINVLKMMANG